MTVVRGDQSVKQLVHNLYLYICCLEHVGAINLFKLLVAISLPPVNRTVLLQLLHDRVVGFCYGFGQTGLLVFLVEKLCVARGVQKRARRLLVDEFNALSAWRHGTGDELCIRGRLRVVPLVDRHGAGVWQGVVLP